MEIEEAPPPPQQETLPAFTMILDPPTNSDLHPIPMSDPASLPISQLQLLGVPAKSRVENQIHLCVRLPNTIPPRNYVRLADEITAPSVFLRKSTLGLNFSALSFWIRNFNFLRREDLPWSRTLANFLVRKKKSTDQNLMDKALAEGSYWIMRMQVVGAENGDVFETCFSCLKREQKNLDARIKTFKGTLEGPTPELNLSRMMQIYSEPMVDFSSGQAVLRTRLTCYSRHHKENVGFVMQAALFDPITDEMVAYGFSTPVLITDDHKTMNSDGSNLKLAPTPSSTSSTSASSRGKRPRDEGSSFSSPDDSSSVDTRPLKKSHIADSSTHLASTIPALHRIIPQEGSVAGGYEVTLLGANLAPHHGVTFGPNLATRITYWSPNSLLVVVPPSLIAGPVPVYLVETRGEASTPIPQNQPCLFTYIDQMERQLLELALQVIGMKLHGRVDSASDVARRILEMDPNQDPNSSFNSIAHQYVGITQLSRFDLLIVSSIEAAARSDSPHDLPIDMQTHSGHTLIHFAAMLALDNVVEHLLSLNANPNIQDSNGWTPLHYAARMGDAIVCQRLLSAGALPQYTSENGELARDVAAPTVRALVAPTSATSPSLSPAFVPPTNTSSSPLSSSIDHSETSISSSPSWTDSRSSRSASKAENFGNPLPRPSQFYPLGKEYEDSVIVDLTGRSSSTPQNTGEVDPVKQSPIFGFWLFIQMVMKRFWTEYRYFLYIALLLLSGTWAVVDYLPLVSAGRSYSTYQQPESVYPLYTRCNPPVRGCSTDTTQFIVVSSIDPNFAPEGAGHFDATLSPGMLTPLLDATPEWLLLAAVTGQFWLFLSSVFLLCHHFRDRLSRVVYFMILIIIIFLMIMVPFFALYFI